MITGYISPDREAVIRFPICDANENEHELQAVLDTGFTGYLTLPEQIVSSLSLPFHSQTTAILGDGRMTVLNQNNAIFVWSGIKRNVLVLAREGTPLLGMGMLNRHDVFMSVIEGGSVTITSHE